MRLDRNLESVICLGLIAVLLAAAFPSAAGAQTMVATDAAPDATAHNSQPKIGRDRAGVIYVTFTVVAGGMPRIAVASSADGGRTWRRHHIAAGRPSRFPSLAVGPDDQVHLAWTQYEDEVGRVYYARFDGRRWTAPVRLSPGLPYAGIPAVAVDPQGRPHVVWYGIRMETPSVRTRHGSIYEILYTRGDGGRWTPPVLISPGIPDSLNPALAADARGGVHSAWYQFDARVYQVRYREQRGAWRAPIQVSTGGGDAFAVAMAVDRSGAVYLVWERRREGEVRLVFARRDAGGGWSGQEAVSEPGGRAHTPTIGVDVTGTVYIAWERDGRLFLRRRAGRWLGVDRIESGGANSGPILSADAVHLMWTQRIGGAPRLRFAVLAALRPAAGPRPLWALLVLAAILAGALWRWVWQTRRPASPG